MVFYFSIFAGTAIDPQKLKNGRTDNLINVYPNKMNKIIRDALENSIIPTPKGILWDTIVKKYHLRKPKERRCCDYLSKVYLPKGWKILLNGDKLEICTSDGAAIITILARFVGSDCASFTSSTSYKIDNMIAHGIIDDSNKDKILNSKELNAIDERRLRKNYERIRGEREMMLENQQIEKRERFFIFLLVALVLTSLLIRWICKNFV